MNKSESKYFNTAIRMDKAMIELLEHKEFEYITIKEICEKAKVNRSTFYLHYDNTRDLLIESVRYINKQFLEYFKFQDESIIQKIHFAPKEELILIKPKYIIPYLTYIKEHKKLFKTAISRTVVMNLDETYQKMFKYVFDPIMEKFNIPVVERSYTARFYVSGIIAIILEWLKNDCDLPIDQISNIIMKCAVSSDYSNDYNKEIN